MKFYSIFVKKIKYLSSAFLLTQFLLPADFHKTFALTHSTFSKRILAKTKGVEVKQCQYIGKGKYFSILNQSKGKTKKFGQNLDTKLHIFRSNGNLIRVVPLWSEERPFSMQDSTDSLKKIHFAISADLKLGAFCHDTSDKKNHFAEIELINLVKFSKLNIFKIADTSCTQNLFFDQDHSSIAFLSNESAKNLHIWDIKRGIKKKIPPRVLEKKCLNVSETFAAAYCFDQKKKRVSSYNLTDGKINWRARLPQSYEPSFFAGILIKLSHLIEKPVPNMAFNISLAPPLLVHERSSPPLLSVFYRFPQQRRDNSQQTYPGALIQNHLETGKTSASFTYEEQRSIELGEIDFIPDKSWIVGADVSIRRPDYKSFYLIDFKKGKNFRFGLECAHDWFVYQQSDTILSCGYCNQKNHFNAWSMQ